MTLLLFRFYLVLFFFITLSSFHTSSWAEEQAADPGSRYPFKLGRLAPDGQPMEFVYRADHQSLMLTHYAEFRSGEAKGRRLRVQLYGKDQTAFTSQNGCHVFSRLSFAPVIFQHFTEEQLKALESFSIEVLNCDPLEDANLETQSEIKENLSLFGLKQNLDDPDWMIRSQAVRALEQKGNDVVADLKEMLSGIDQNQREYAAIALFGIQTAEAQTALGAYQASSPELFFGDTKPHIQDGLSLGVQPSQPAFPFGDMLSMDLTLTNHTEKAMALYDPHLCDLSWTFKMEDLKRGGYWIGHFPRTYEVVSPQPVYLKANDSFRVRCPVDLFYWKATQDDATPPSRWDRWERRLPEGKYQARVSLILSLPYQRPDSSHMFWIGAIESQPAVFDITPQQSEPFKPNQWTEKVEMLRAKYPRIGLWKAILEIAADLGSNNSSLRIKAVQFLAALIGIFDLEQRKEFLPILMELFSDSDASVRHLVSEALSGLNINPTSALVQTLQKDTENIMEGSHYDSVMWTLRTLKRLRTPEADKALLEYCRSLLLKLSQATDSDARAALMNSVVEIGEVAEKVFLQGIQDPSPRARADSALILGILGARKASEPLQQLLDDQPAEVLTAAAFALLMIGDPVSEKAVTSRSEQFMPLFLKQLKSEEARTRWRGVFGIKSMGERGKAAIPELIRVLGSDEIESVRLIAYKTLEQFDDPEAAKAVAQHQSEVETEKTGKKKKGAFYAGLDFSLDSDKKANPDSSEASSGSKAAKEFLYSGRTSTVMRGKMISKDKLPMNKAKSKESKNTAPPKILDGKSIQTKPLPKESFETLKNKLTSGAQSYVREDAAIELAAFGEEAISVLAQALQDPEFHVRFAARMSLIKIGTPAAKEAAKLKAKSSEAPATTSA